MELSIQRTFLLPVNLRIPICKETPGAYTILISLNYWSLYYYYFYSDDSTPINLQSELISTIPSPLHEPTSSIKSD